MRKKGVSKEKLLDMLLVRSRTIDSLAQDNARLKDALAYMQEERDCALRKLKGTRTLRDDYARISDDLWQARADLSITKTDMRILQEALVDKKAGNPNWEKVAELKMRKARC